MRRIEWIQRDRSKLIREVVVWVDIAKADLLWQPSSFYVAIGAPRSRDKYFGFGRWISDSSRVVQMAEVGFYKGVLDFTNGRHRFAWMRDHGASAIPVCMAKADSRLAKDLMATDLRTCEINL